MLVPEGCAAIVRVKSPSVEVVMLGALAEEEALAAALALVSIGVPLSTPRRPIINPIGQLAVPPAAVKLYVEGSLSGRVMTL